MTDVPIDVPLTLAAHNAKPLAGHIRFRAEPRDVPLSRAIRATVGLSARIPPFSPREAGSDAHVIVGL